MPTIDFTSGYRDATQGSTLKALAQRRAEMAANMAARKTPQINDPWQGAAEVANTISGSIREGRLASQEAAGRQRFAQLLSGGLAPDEIGEAMGLDPETTQMYVKNDWDVKAAADRVRAEKESQAALFGQQDKTQAAQEQAALTLADHNATIEEKQHAQQVIDNAKVAETLAGTQTAQREQEAALTPADAKLDAAVKAGTMTQEAADAQKDLNRRTAEADIASKTPDRALPLTPEDAAKWGGDVAKNPANYYIDQKTGKPTLINPSTFSPAEQEKRTYDTKSKINAIDGGLDELNRALEIAPDVTELGAVGREGYSLTGYLPESWVPEDLAKTANATKRFDQIMQSNAIKRMAAELSGSDSDKDVSRFVALMADPNSTLTQKKQMIASMIATLQRERGVTRDRLKGITGQDAGEYKYTNPDVSHGDSAAVPAAAGAGGAAAPAAAGGAAAAPAESTYSEDDIQETMRANNMTRQQVLDALAKQKAGGQ